MSKRETDKEWQKRNPNKVKAYYDKYMQSKKRVNLTLNASTLAAIDEVKADGQEYATWIRNFLEKWENTRDTV